MKEIKKIYPGVVDWKEPYDGKARIRVETCTPYEITLERLPPTSKH